MIEMLSLGKKKSSSRSHHERREHSSSDSGVKLYLSKLGSSISERKIKEEFEHFGDVVDYSLKRKSGKSTNYFGYVVMKNKSEAEEAMRYLSKQ